MAELEFNSVDLRRADKSMRFIIVSGWMDQPADVRGEDTIVPGRTGRTRRNRQRDVRTVVMNGILEAQTWEEMLELQMELAAVWSPAADPEYLVVADQYLGLAEGEVASLLCATVNVTPDASDNPFIRRYVWQLESIDTPPEWVLESGS